MSAGSDKVFGVQRHDATRAGLHYDLRLERDGMLKSWSIPKGMPTNKRHLAIATPDHKISWLKFEGNIPEGSYGAGNVKLDSKSTYKTVSYKPKKWVFYVNAGKYQGKYTLVYWKDNKWLISRNKDQSMAAENTEVLNAEWFTWYSGQYVLVRNVYRIYNRSVTGEEIVFPEEYSLLDDAVEELVNLIEYDPSIFEMGVYKIQSGIDPKVSLEVKYKHQEFSGDNPEAVKMADEKSYDRWNRDYLIDEPDDFLIGATDYGDIVSEVFTEASEDEWIVCQNCDQKYDVFCPQCGQPTCNTHFRSQFNSCQDCFKYLSQFMSETNKKLYFMDPKRRLRKLVKDIDLDPETASKRISFNADNDDEKIYSYDEMKAVFDKASNSVTRTSRAKYHISQFWLDVRPTILYKLDRTAPRYSKREMEIVRRGLERYTR